MLLDQCGLNDSRGQYCVALTSMCCNGCWVQLCVALTSVVSMVAGASGQYVS